MSSRSQRLEKIRARHYIIGKAVAALTKLGPLKSPELSAIIEVGPPGLWWVLSRSDKFELETVPHTWVYESTGKETNKKINREVWQYSLAEVAV